MVVTTPNGLFQINLSSISLMFIKMKKCLNYNYKIIEIMGNNFSYHFLILWLNLYGV